MERFKERVAVDGSLEEFVVAIHKSLFQLFWEVRVEPGNTLNEVFHLIENTKSQRQAQRQFFGKAILAHFLDKWCGHCRLAGWACAGNDALANNFQFREPNSWNYLLQAAEDPRFVFAFPCEQRLPRKRPLLLLLQ